jgi:hypothetical protein
VPNLRALLQPGEGREGRLRRTGQGITELVMMMANLTLIESLQRIKRHCDEHDVPWYVQMRWYISEPIGRVRHKYACWREVRSCRALVFRIPEDDAEMERFIHDLVRLTSR